MNARVSDASGRFRGEMCEVAQFSVILRARKEVDVLHKAEEDVCGVEVTLCVVSATTFAYRSPY